ncbi:hypothetical protein BKA69DRAFT_1039607 [Paraphysoderma sedebokerense]|nr:hypothetical protein BKA69DRAFT_1039607 [Paraphysoderma sedebokerense]
METFRSKYLARCKELLIDPSTVVLEQSAFISKPPCHSRSNSGDHDVDLHGRTKYPDTIDLSGHNVTLKAASALASALSEDVVFTKIILQDAFMGDDACTVLCSALKTNTTVRKLDLRGNNIRSEGAVSIAQLIKVNSAIKTLSLEWNCIGVWDTGVKAIADALKMNTTLVELDLRNNKIGPSGVEVLALSLKHNTGLKRLDLRWNNAGLMGGKALVDMLQWNTVITEIELAGNEVSEECSRSISIALQKNHSQHAHRSHCRSQAVHLSSTLQALTSSHLAQINQLKSQLEETDTQSRSLAKKLVQASDEIERTHVDAKSLERKYNDALREKEKLEEVLIRERSEWGFRVKELEKELASMKESKASIESHHQAQLAASTKKNLTLESTVSSYEAELTHLKQTNSQLEATVTQLREKQKYVIRNYEEKIIEAEKVAKDELQEALDRCKQDQKEVVRKLEERLKNVEASREQAVEMFGVNLKFLLIQELDRQKAKFIAQKNQFEDKLRSEEETRRQHLQSQITNMETQLSTLQSQHSALRGSHEKLQASYTGAQNTSANTISSLQSEIATLQSELAAKLRLLQRLDMLEMQEKKWETEKKELLKRVETSERAQKSWEERDRRRKEDERTRLKELETAFGRFLGGLNSGEDVDGKIRGGGYGI